MAVAKKVVEPKIVLAPIVVGSVDSTEGDVLKYNSEGRKLFFLDDEDTFLELTPEAQKCLSLENRKRYDVAKGISSNEPVGEAMIDSINGYSTDYNVRPGSSSANLAVFGQKQGMDYFWERPENIDKRRYEGWQVDTDKNVHTVHKESCSHSTVGRKVTRNDSNIKTQVCDTSTGCQERRET